MVNHFPHPANYKRRFKALIAAGVPFLTQAPDAGSSGQGTGSLRRG